MAMSKRPSASPWIWKVELGVGVSATRMPFCSKKPWRSAAQSGRLKPPGKTMTLSVFKAVVISSLLRRILFIDPPIVKIIVKNPTRRRHGIRLLHPERQPLPRQSAQREPVRARDPRAGDPRRPHRHALVLDRGASLRLA